LERLLEEPPARLSGLRLGLLCNPASVDFRLRHARRLVAETFPGRLRALYSPQHGFFAEKQDNMIESADRVDPLLKLPVYSLYGDTRIPTAAMLEPIDVLLVDLQDVGTRVYTFVTTVSYCLEAARRCGKKVVVLDRPNPISGRQAEGNVLKPNWASFVGRYPIPMRHAMTIGELALLINDYGAIGCELEVVPMRGWLRAMYHEDTGLPWVAPSPNLPTPAAAAVYPGQVVWEGTNVSEGRGTTQPFEIFGAPFLQTDAIREDLGAEGLPGCVLRPVVFEPTANKWQGKACHGFQLHVTDREAYRPYLTSLRLLQAVIRRHPEEFDWKRGPYEYEFERSAIDLIIGDGNIRARLAALEPLADIEADWQKELAEFHARRAGHLLYPESAPAAVKRRHRNDG